MLQLIRRHSTIFVILLVFGLIFDLVGLSIAQAAPGKAERGIKKQELTAKVGEIPNNLPEAKLELKSKRTKYSSRYLNPDGSFTEEIFLEPQFYQDQSDKKWKKIDNSLEASIKKQGNFKNKANDYTTHFAEQGNTDELVSIEKNGNKIGLKPINANQVKGKIQKNRIKYNGIFENVDLQYTVKGDAVKEELILYSLPDNNIFSFELSMNGNLNTLVENNTIFITDKDGNKLWYFEKPYMTDANDQHSDKVSLTLRKENKKIYIDLTIDQNFLQNPETQYPVVVDPTISNWNMMVDSFVASAFPDSYYYSNTLLYTGSDPYYFGTMRSYVQFYLPTLPSESKIQNATFSAYQTKSDATNTSIDLFRVNESWDGFVTWNNQPNVGASAESTKTNNQTNSYWEWDISQLILDWYNGAQPNYGIMLKQQNETSTPFRSFNSYNMGTNAPKLTINYKVDPIGIEEFWKTTSDGVNPANGNLVFQQNDLAVSGRGITVDITRTYNSRKSMVPGIFGYGWTSSTEAQLVDSGAGPITLIDDDGTRHIFGQGSGGTYVSHGGVYLTLNKKVDGTYTLVKPDETQIHFNANGKITSFIDTNGNTTTFNYDTSDQLTSIIDASGRTTAINYGTNGYVSSITDPANKTINYSYDSNGNLTGVTDADNYQTTFNYDSNHNLTNITNGRNITTTINYDGSDRVDSISQPITINGIVETSTTNYSYDIVNDVTTVTDGEGLRIDYSYNANGNIVQISENPLGSVDKAVTTFSYDDNNNLTEVKDANTNAVSGNSTYIYTYDENGNITAAQLPESQTAEFKYDSKNNLTQILDFKGNTSSYDYDSGNNQIEATDPQVQTEASSYDSVGNLSYNTHPMSVADNLLPNASFELDSDANGWADEWAQHVETGKTATFNWADTAKLGEKSISISSPTGWTLTSSPLIPYESGEKYIVSGYIKTEGTTNTAIIKVEFFDSNNAWIGQQYSFGLKGTHDWTRVQKVVNNVPTETTKIRVSVGLNAGSGTAYFDGVQLEKGTILSAFNIVDNSSFERDDNTDGIPNNWVSSGNLTANDGIDQYNPALNNVYVGNNSFKLAGQSGVNKYIKQHIKFSGNASTPLTLSGWSKQEGADPNGGNYLMQIAINYTDGHTDWSNANDFDKSTSGWQHVAAKVNILPDKQIESIDVYYLYYNQTGTAWFDAMRLEVGNTFSTFDYDTNGNYVTSSTNPAGDTTTSTYDAVGNVISYTDGKQNTTSYEYNSRNLLTKVTDADHNITSYSYDAVGNPTSVTNAKNKTANYSYNELNLLSSITDQLNQATRLEYDLNGNLTKTAYSNGDSVSYTYNDLNRMDNVFYNGSKKWTLGYDANGNMTSVTDDLSQTTSYTYDKNDRLTQQAKGSNNQIDYSYDNNSNVTSMTATAGAVSYTVDYTYNPLDQMVAMNHNNSQMAEFVYDERGNIISVSHWNGSYTAYQYDEANRIRTVKNYTDEGDLIDSYTYNYDANSNKTSVQTPNGTIFYQYDVLNQLTQETLLDGTIIDYQYDVVGNRTQKSVNNGTTTITTTYNYDDANQLINLNGQAYTYDANGNMTSNGEKTFIYNEENRLVEVKDSSGVTIASFTYDHTGKRVSMTSANGTIYYHYDGEKVAYETDENNTIIAEYIWDEHDHPVAMFKNQTTYFYHVNGHGDVTALTDINGNIVAEYEYDAWGNILSQSGTMASENPYRYAGYRFDETTGLYYLMARYYDANIGRFITRDTFHGFQVEPLSLNQYDYVHNNPINFVDPSGHIRWRWAGNRPPRKRSRRRRRRSRRRSTASGYNRWANIDPSKIDGNFSVSGFPSANQISNYENSRMGKAVNAGINDVISGYTSDTFITGSNKAFSFVWGAGKASEKATTKLLSKTAIKAGIKEALGGPAAYFTDAVRFSRGFLKSYFGKDSE